MEYNFFPVGSKIRRFFYVWLDLLNLLPSLVHLQIENISS